MRKLSLSAATVAAFLGAAAPAYAGDPIMALSDVQAGMVCTGYSVVRGTEPVSFRVDVLDVIAGSDSPNPPGPAILVKTSGPAVDATGMGQGFSGSPIYCPDATGVQRNIGAISAAIGDYGHSTVLATPIQAMLSNDPFPTTPRNRSLPANKSGAKSTPGKATPIASSVMIRGLSPAVHSRLGAAMRKQGGALASYNTVAPRNLPVTPLKPGSAVTVSAATGDLNVAGMGTVTYVDGDKVWAFGHALDGAGRRSLLMSQGYVSGVIRNPGMDVPSYKLGAVGRPIGTISNDALNAVVGTVGPTPTMIPLKVIAHDVDNNKTSTTNLQITDETDVDSPASVLGGVQAIAPLAILEAGSTILKSNPGRQSGSACARITIKERKKPLRFCNRYVVADTPPSMGGMGQEQPVGMSSVSAVAQDAAKDVMKAISGIAEFKAKALHITGVEVNLKIRRGAQQGYIRSVKLPARVRPGQTVRAKMEVQRVRGRLEKLSFKLKIPRSIRPGMRTLTFQGHSGANSLDSLLSDIASMFTGKSPGMGEDDEGDDGFGPETVEALATQVRGLHLADGVTLSHSAKATAAGEGTSVYKKDDLLISGKYQTMVKVVSKTKKKKKS